MAKGTAPGRVRVSPARFKKLKKIISNCDREIQWRDVVIDECSRILKAYIHQSTLERKNKCLQERHELDAKRKAARLELKGYG